MQFVVEQVQAVNFTAVRFSIEPYTGISMQLNTGVEGQVVAAHALPQGGSAAQCDACSRSHGIAAARSQAAEAQGRWEQAAFVPEMVRVGQGHSPGGGCKGARGVNPAVRHLQLVTNSRFSKLTEAHIRK